MQNVRCRFIGSEKVPHPAEIPRRKARVVGAFGCKILCCRHSCSFFCSGADQFPDFEIQLHLRQISSKRLIQTSVHCAVINGLSDVHGLSPFRRSAPYSTDHGKEKYGIFLPHFSLP